MTLSAQTVHSPHRRDAEATERRHEAVLKLWNDGLAANAIAERFGISTSTVDDVLKAMRARGRFVASRRAAPPKFDWTDDRIAELKRRWLAGESAVEIAAAMGCTKGAVNGQVSRLNLTRGDAAAGATDRGVADANLKRYFNRTSSREEPPRPPRPFTSRRELLTPTATLETLGAHACRWPIGEPGQPGFGYCGRRTDGRYCFVHSLTAFQADSQLTDREIRGLVRLAHALRPSAGDGE